MSREVAPGEVPPYGRDEGPFVSLRNVSIDGGPEVGRKLTSILPRDDGTSLQTIDEASGTK